MRHSVVLILSTLLLAGPALAAVKPCEELKAEIAAKLEAKGVRHYSLTVVDADKVGEAQVVGSCDGGRRKIIYERK